MDKSPDAFRTISEVAEWLGVQTHVLRFWESKFSQVKPVKRAGGRRYYRPTDMLLLGGIKKLLHDDGMTIKGVQKLLREEGVSHVSSFSQPLETGAEAAEEAVSENVVRFTARPEDVAAAEPAETVVEIKPAAPEPTPSEVAADTPEEPSAPQPDAAHLESASNIAAPPASESEVPPPTAEPEVEASPLPAFLTQPMGGTAETAKPRIVDAPDPPADAQIMAQPGLLPRVAGLGSVDPDIARQLTPLVARLAVLRDRLNGSTG